MNPERKTAADLVVVEDSLALVSKAQEGVEARYFVSLQKHSGFRKDALAGNVGVNPKTIDNLPPLQKEISAGRG